MAGDSFLVLVTNFENEKSLKHFQSYDQANSYAKTSVNSNAESAEVFVVSGIVDTRQAVAKFKSGNRTFVSYHGPKRTQKQIVADYIKLLEWAKLNDGDLASKMIGR